MMKTDEIIEAMNKSFNYFQELQNLKDQRKQLIELEVENRKKIKELIPDENKESEFWDIFVFGNENELKEKLKSYFKE